MWRICPSEPTVCTPLADCGNGLLDGGEDCDDGDTDDGDGCSRVCDVEDGWACDTSVEPSVCEEQGGDVGPGDDGPGDVGPGDVGDTGDVGEGDEGVADDGFSFGGGSVSGCCAVAAAGASSRSWHVVWALAAVGLAVLRRRRRTS